MPVMPVDYTALLIVSSTIKGLAAVLTLLRLGFRLKIQRFWWEDVWAAVALLCTVGSIISVLVVSLTDDYGPSLITGRIDRQLFTSIVWSVRMSLIFSIIRIVFSTRQRRIGLALAVYFSLCWAVTLGLRAWWCTNYLRKQVLLGTTTPHCVLPRFEMIFEAITNCVADVMTVIFALKLLWRVKLPQRQRRMFLCLFSSSKFLCVISLARLITRLVGTRRIQAVFADLQLAVFLIVCNLLVVVTYVYRVFLSFPDEEDSSGSEDPSDDDFTTAAPTRRSQRTGQTLTTVDLGPYMNTSGISRELNSIFFPSGSTAARVTHFSKSQP